MPQPHNYANFLAFAHTLANQSRKIIQEYISKPVNFITKNDQSPVTEVDQKVERALRNTITSSYPDHGILGEEYDSENLSAEYIWVIDPVDGTKAFITGMPVYGTLISLTRDGFPILGIIDHPVTEERWTGLEGIPTTYNGYAIHTRTCSALEESILSIGNPESLSVGEAEAFANLRKASKWAIYGGNCYVYGQLSMGRLDISVDSGLAPFDYCALDAVVRGAGGYMSDWEGKRLSIYSGHRVVACGDHECYKKAVAILKNA